MNTLWYKIKNTDWVDFGLVAAICIGLALIVLLILWAAYVFVFGFDDSNDLAITCNSEHTLVYIEIGNVSALYLDQPTYERFCGQ